MSHGTTTTCGSCGGVIEAKPANTSQLPAGSLQPVASACTCGTSCKSSCPTPTTQASPCEEDHCKEVVINNFSATVKTTSSFNFPAIGSSAKVKLANVTSLIPGQILWNQGVGRLHVLDFDTVTREVTLNNLGDSCTTTGAAVGELIQSCTEFGVSIPECNTGGGGSGGTAGPYLAADFVAPGNGNCANAKVTTVIGLALNDIVSVSGFQYRINQIYDTETIELCDEGEGAPLGQVIEWDPNCDEIPDIPLIVLSGENPCVQTPKSSGKIVICDDSDLLTTLAGSQTGQVPVWDKDLGKFTLVSLNLENQCTYMTACFIVNIGDDGPYITAVDDTSFFQVGQEVRIDGDLFEISGIPDGTHLELVPVVTPPAIKEYAEGEQVCLRDCCEVIGPCANDLCDLANNPPGLAFGDAGLINILDTQAAADPSTWLTNRYFRNAKNDTAAFQFAYTNSSPHRQYVEILLNVTQSVLLGQNGADAGNVQAYSEVQLGTSGDTTSIGPRASAYFDSRRQAAGTVPDGFMQAATSSGWNELNVQAASIHRAGLLLPGQSVTYNFRHGIIFESPSSPAYPALNNIGYFLFMYGTFKAFKYV